MNSIDVVFCADANVVRPLATAIASVARSLRPGEKGRVFVLSSGISPSDRERIAAFSAETRPELVWIECDLGDLPELPPKARKTQAPFLKMRMAELLPGDVECVVYLDTDVIVRAPIAELASSDLGGGAVGAVVDANLPFLGMSPALVRWRREGVDPRTKYLNSGVMVVDLDRWRQEEVGPRALRFARSNEDAVHFVDQDALNWVLLGLWTDLDRRWNVMSSVFLDHGVTHCVSAAEDIDELRESPRIVHFTGKLPRPWVRPGAHPLSRIWYEMLPHTAWKDWRPEPPSRFRLVGRRVRKALMVLKGG